MSIEPNKRQVPITNRKTGQVHLSDPIPVHGSISAAPDPVATDVTRPTTVAMAQAKASSPVSDMPFPQAKASSAPGDELTATVEAEKDEKAGKMPRAFKPKSEIETLEQFIEYAYARRGQRASLPLKVQQAIGQQLSLGEAAMSRLLVLVNADTLLAVPRQILLASREVEGLPTLRGALASFVSMVMLRHPAFALEGVQAAAANRPGASTAADALRAVVAFRPADVEGTEPLKPAELKELRRNAAHLLVTWFANHRGLGLEEVSNLLLQVLWAPAATELSDDNARLRALTEVEDFAGLGVAANRYRLHAAEAHAGHERALREAEMLSKRVAELSEQRDHLQMELDSRVVELGNLRVSSAQELSDLRQAHSAGSMHQSHELESLRGRLVRRLEDSIEMLDVGLNALRNKTPRVEVMLERAEHVLDDLRAELHSLIREE